jgi:hypothetical protein
MRLPNPDRAPAEAGRADIPCAAREIGAPFPPNKIFEGMESMKKQLAAGLLGLTLSMAALAAAPALAQAPAAAAAGPSVTVTTITDLLANPATKAVVDKYIPGLATAPQLDMVKGMTLKQLSQFPQAQLDDAKLAAIQAEFDKIK